MALPRRLEPSPFGADASTTSSTMVFHSLQDSHFPDHLEVTTPQDWQLYCLEDLAMQSSVYKFKTSILYEDMAERHGLSSLVAVFYEAKMSEIALLAYTTRKRA